jgi:outer membrane protein TolC
LAASDLALAALDRTAAELRREAGAASEPELARLALAAGRAAAAVAAAEHEVAAADRLLRLTLGAEVGPPTGPLPDPLAWLADATAAWELRVDVLNARLQVAETDRLASSTLRDNLPSGTLSVGGTFGGADRLLQVGAAVDTRALQPTINLSYDPDTGPPGLDAGHRSRTFTVAVGLRVPLNPAVGDAIAAARVGAELAAAQLELATERAEIDVEQRRVELETTVANAELAQAGAELALAELELARLRHAGGHLAEIALRRAEIEVDRARLDAARANDATRLAALRLLDALAVDPADLE